MRRVFPLGELGLAGFQEPRENGAEIVSCLGRACAAKVFEAPDHAGGTKIEAGVAVANSFVERVRGPELLGIEMFKPIRDDVLDCAGSVALAPADRPQRHVTSTLDHEPSIAQRLRCAHDQLASCQTRCMTLARCSARSRGVAG